MNFLYKLNRIKLELLLFLIILTVGIFLRTYNFSNWLHFEIDQSYDTLLVSPAVEDGIGNLPLLGPTAGGGRALRLGPAFYYLEYLSAKAFGNTPPGHAALVLIFSCLSLPFFYLFLKRYFPAPLSLGLLSIYASSLYMVVYSRFSWSPNVLPFLILLCFYALLRCTDTEEKRKGAWFIITAGTLAIITQIHFNAFFIAPTIVALFLLLKRPHFRLKTWLFALLIFILFYSPVIISDMKTGGENAQFFIEKLSKNKNASLAYLNKTVQTLQYTASEYFLIITGIDNINGAKLNGFGLQADEPYLARIAGLFFFALTIILLVLNLYREKNPQRRDFLWLSLLWLLVSTLYFFSLLRGGFKLFPRFFLIVSPLPLILLGLILEKIYPKKNQRGGAVLLVLILSIILATNAYGLKHYFDQLKKVGYEDIPTETEDVFPNTGRITLEQQLAITDYIKTTYQKNKYPVYLMTKHEYEPVFWYHLEKNGISYQQKLNNDRAYEQGNYFLIVLHEKTASSFWQNFSIIEKKNFGALTVYRIAPKPQVIVAPKQGPAQKETPIQKIQIDQILTWKKLFTK